MIPDFARGSPGLEAAVAAVVFAAALAVALLAHPILTRVARIFAARTKTTLDDVIVAAVSRPLFLFILVHGTFLALTTNSYLNDWQGAINKTWVIVAGGVIIYGIQRVLSAFLKWYASDIASRAGGRADEKFLPLVRRFLIGVVYAVGGLLILDNIGVQLSPLLAGLGLGGLAVALALQPTLSNIISSAYMVADGSLSVGDFIEVQGGPSGFVVDVGWRSTKIRTPTNNLVVMPNSRLADSVLTNFTYPTPAVGTFVTCGVSYESDLQKVETVALEVANSVVRDLGDEVVERETPPSVLFREFGDSNITFIVVMRGRNRGATFTIQHELIKRLHARFGREGIEINYPVRKLVMPPPRRQDTHVGPGHTC